MNSIIRDCFDQLEHERIALLNKLTDVPPNGKLDYKPNDRKWSINEILMHLITSEKLTLNYLKKKSLGVDQLPNSRLLESLKMIVLKGSQRLPFLKFNAPKALIENTPQVTYFHEMARDWELSRRDFRKFLESIPEKDIHKLIYKHPVAGRFDIIQCLTFMQEHFNHHLPQINALLK